MVYGVGYNSGGKFKCHKPNSRHTKLYRIWVGMLERCYSPQPKYKKYRDNGVYVSERWHDYQVFCKDILEFPNFLDWAKRDSGYHLDKDVICDEQNISPKVYSKETCLFITARRNTLQMFKEKLGKAREYTETCVFHDIESGETKVVNIYEVDGVKSGSIRNCINNRRVYKNKYIFKDLNEDVCEYKINVSPIYEVHLPNGDVKISENANQFERDHGIKMNCLRHYVKNYPREFHGIKARLIKPSHQKTILI